MTGQPHVGILLGASHDENDYRPAVWRRTVEGRKLVFAYEVVSADDFGEGISVCTGPNALGCAGHRIELPAGASIVAASDGLPAKLDYAAGGAPVHDYGVAGGTAALTGGICDRTPQVRDAIVEEISQYEGDPWNCSEVEADGILAELADDGEEFTLDLSDAGIASLKAGDFAGILAYRLDLSGNALTNLSREMLPDKVSDRLDLSGNALTQIPAGLIRGLGVKKVDFSGNAIAHVAREGFAGGGAMTQLDLSDNRIATLPDGVFEELTGLTALDLDGNAGTASFVPALAIEVPDLAERVYAGQTVTLRGSSSGPWGTNVSYAWTNDAGNTPQLALTGASLAAASFEAPTRSAPTIYRFHLVVTGRGGSGYAVSDVLEVNVQKQPYVLSAAVTSRPRTQSGANADTYGAGEAIEITVGFNEPVEVTGAPHIKIQVGTARRSAVYVRHASPSQLVFAKTMSATDADTDGFGVHSTAIELGTNDRIRNRHGAAAASYPLGTVTGPKDKVKGSFTAPAGGICGRSGAVAAALLARVKANDSSVAGCADVTAAHLAALSGTLTVASSALDAGDFAGLDRIAGLDLGGGGLVAPPAGVFDPLASLTALKLHDNALRSLPAGLFDALAGLVTLRLDGNAGLGSVPDGIFERLGALATLQIDGPVGQFAPVAGASAEAASATPEQTFGLDGTASMRGPWGSNASFAWERVDAQGAVLAPSWLTGAGTPRPSVTVPLGTPAGTARFRLSLSAPAQDPRPGYGRARSRPRRRWRWRSRPRRRWSRRRWSRARWRATPTARARRSRWRSSTTRR